MTRTGLTRHYRAVRRLDWQDLERHAGVADTGGERSFEVGWDRDGVLGPGGDQVDEAPFGWRPDVAGNQEVDVDDLGCQLDRRRRCSLQLTLELVLKRVGGRVRGEVEPGVQILQDIDGPNTAVWGEERSVRSERDVDEPSGRLVGRLSSRIEVAAHD
jgi:hypothetical protein